MSGETGDLEGNPEISAAELRELRKGAAEFEAFVASFPDLYFRIAADGRIVDYRARAAELYTSPDVFLGVVRGGS